MDKYEKLKNIIKEMESVLVAYSGGADSTFLLKAVSETIRDSSLAVTADSSIRQRKEIIRARQMAERFGIRHIILDSRELRDGNVNNNRKDRCYFCKKGLFSELAEVAGEYGIRYIADGSNVDDTGYYRPGKKALEELNVRSPLLEAGLTKEEIRKYSKILKLETWDVPSESCYLTRFPYDTEIDAGKIRRVALAEEFLDGLGFREVRVRSYENLARIEVSMEQVPLLEGKIFSRVKGYLEKIGFTNITVDPKGYRTGSMDGE